MRDPMHKAAIEPSTAHPMRAMILALMSLSFSNLAAFMYWSEEIQKAEEESNSTLTDSTPFACEAS
jgi:hypothetical protein